MKGLFIPGITKEMFRDASVESIAELMADGEIYDIDYQEPCKEQEPILVKIRTEIADITDTVEINPESFWNKKLYVRYSDVLNIINKYRAESEE